jgi:hypothetical protein
MCEHAAQWELLRPAKTHHSTAAQGSRNKTAKLDATAATVASYQ